MTTRSFARGHEASGKKARNPKSIHSQTGAEKRKEEAKVFHFPQRHATQQREPKPPLPAQHQEKPGIEAEIEPRPKYLAPL
ncbi:MAG TPA: hypothetical protein VFZ99_08135, partial [Terriglobales bacterium]